MGKVESKADLKKLLPEVLLRLRTEGWSGVKYATMGAVTFKQREKPVY